MSDQDYCKNCGILTRELEDCKAKNRELEDLNEKLTIEIQNLIAGQQNATKIQTTFDAELELKKGLFGSLTQSQVVSSESTPSDLSSGTNFKKLQQELRVSKKAEQLAKEKLAQTKKALEKSERDFIKYREDTESRIESLKNEISILQKHYDQLQNSIGEQSEQAEKSSANGGSNNEKSAELIKIIEDYSKQNESKTKEIEALTQRLDSKLQKLNDLKKNKSDQDSRLAKQKSTLDNVKTFLRLLNSNFLKSMKQQNAHLKELMLSNEREFQREVQDMKQSIQGMAVKIIEKKEKQMTLKLEQESKKNSEMKEKLRSLQQEYESKISQMRIQHEDILKNQKEASNQKISLLKQKIKNISEQQLSHSESHDILKEQYQSQIQTFEKQIHALQILLDSEKEKHQLQVSDFKKEIQVRTDQVNDLKEREASLVKKLEDIEDRHRRELSNLVQKLDQEKIRLIESQTKEVSGQREAERMREFKEIYEGKAREKEDEIKRIRELLSKVEGDYSKAKEEWQKRGETFVIEKKEKESEITNLKNQTADFKAILEKKTQKISQLKKKIEDSILVISSSNKERDNLDRQLQKLQSNFDHLTSEANNLKSQLQVSDTQYKSSQEQVQSLNHQLQSLKDQFAKDQDNLQSHLKAEQNENANVKSFYTQLIKENDLKITELQSQVQELSKEVKEWSNKYDQANNQRERAEARYQETAESVEQLTMKHQSQITQKHDELAEKDELIRQLSQQIDSLQVKLQENRPMQMATKTPTKPKKKVIKKKKMMDAEIQTDEIILQISETIEHPQIRDVQEETRQNENLKHKLKIDTQIEESNQEKSKEREQVPSPAKSINSDTVRATHNEEDSFVPEFKEESVERHQPRADFQPDLAMRNPGMIPGGRPPAPRPAGGAMAGRGGMASQFRPPQFRPAGNPFGNVPQPRGGAPSQPVQVNEVPIAQVEMQQQQQLRVENEIQRQEPQVEEQKKRQTEEVKAPVQQAKMNPFAAPQQMKSQVKKEEDVKQSPFQAPVSRNEPLKEKEQKSDVKKEHTNQEPVLQDKKEQVTQESKEQSKKEEEKKAAPVPLTQAQQQASILDFRNNRFFGMINGFLSYLTRNRRGYTGRPASAMYYDEKKGRYVIEGEDDSDDDVPPPPPPVKKKEEQKQPAEENKTEAQMNQTTSAESLTRPAFAGALANRGRGRGRGGPVNRFPQVFNAAQLSENKVEPPKEEEKTLVPQQKPMMIQDSQVQNETIQDQASTQPGVTMRTEYREEVSELYTTTMDITLNQTQIHTQLESQAILETSVIIQQPRSLQQQDVVDEAREQQWQRQFQQQNDKISNLKYKMSMLQKELIAEREQNEQTIENFTILCQDLKFKGNDEVEDLQTDLQILKDQLKKLNQEKAVYEVKLYQLNDQTRFQEDELRELRQQIRDQKYKLIEGEIEREMLKMNNRQASEGTQAQGEQNFQEDQSKQIIELQVEIESLRWQKSISEAEKLSKTLDLKEQQSQLDKLKTQLERTDLENSKLQEDIRRLESEQAIYGQEQVVKLEKEKDAIREMMQKIQNEKERIHEQHRERIEDYEGRIKKYESERAKSEQEQSRGIRERENQIDQLKNQNLQLNQIVSQKDEEIKWLTNQAKEQQQKITALNQKRQSESEQTEQMLRAQLKQVQDILLQKTSQLEEWQSKGEEFNQELQSMSTLRHKLTENIVYLQNEIRKRDELLESSEFGDIDMIGEESESVIGPEDESVRGGDLQSNRGEDDNVAAAGQSSMRQSFVKDAKKKRRNINHALQNQLDETRQNLKQQIEEKMRSQRKVQNLELNFKKLVDGLQDVHKILDYQQKDFDSNMVGEQSSSLFTEEEEIKANEDQQNDYENLQIDDTIHEIITKVFSLQRVYESEISELKHKIKMMTMQLEEGENLKFDIEILSDEKNLLDQELNQQRSYSKDLELKIQELRTQINDKQSQEEDHKQQLKLIKEQGEKQMQKERQEFESLLAQTREDTQKQIDEMHQTFKTQMLPAVKQKYQSKYQKLQESLSQMRDSMNEQLEESRKYASQLEQQNQTLLNQTTFQIEQESEEKDRLREKLQFLEIQKQELENNLSSLKSQYEQKITEQAKDIEILQHDNEELKTANNKQIEKLVKDFEEIAQRLKAKNDQKKKKLKEYSQKMKQVIHFQTEENQKQESLRRSLEDERDVALNDAQLLKATLESHQKEIQSLTQQIQKLRADKESEQVVRSGVEDLQAYQQKLQEEMRVKSEEFEQEKVQMQQRFEEELRELQVQIQNIKQEHQSIIEQREQAFHHQIEALKKDKDELQTSLYQQDCQKAQQQQEEERNDVVLKQQLDELKSTNSLLESQIQALQSQAEVYQKQIQDLQSSESLKSQELNAKVNQVNEKDLQIVELNNQLEEAKKSIEQAKKETLTSSQYLKEEEWQNREQEIRQAIKEEWEIKINQKINEFEQERQEMIDNYTQREEQFKQQTELIVKKLKDTIKKEKEKAKNALEELQRLLTDKQVLEQQIIDLKNQFRAQIDQKESQKASDIQNLELQLYEQKSQLLATTQRVQDLQEFLAKQQQDYESLFQEQQLMIEQVINILSLVDVVIDKTQATAIWPTVVLKLKEVLQNYDEDRRSLKTLIEEKENLIQLSDQYQREKESVLSEKSRLEEKLEHTSVGKLEKKVKMLEEERSEMKSDFYIKINSFVSEIDQLKSKLSRYEASVIEERSEEDSDPVSKESFASSSKVEERPDFMDQSKTSHINKNDQTQVQRSGIFNSIASFFLTDSELENQ